MPACAGREPGGTGAGLLAHQRLPPVRKLRCQGGGLIQTLLVQYRRAVAAQADLRERGKLGRQLLRGGQSLTGCRSSSERTGLVLVLALPLVLVLVTATPGRDLNSCW